MPTPANSNLLGIQEKGSYFSDIKWVMKTDLSFNKKRSDENIKTKILSSTRVLRAIDEEALRRVENKNLKIEDVKLAVQREAVRMVEETVG